MERRLRELAIGDILRVVGYFRYAAPDFMEGMGVDRYSERFQLLQLFCEPYTLNPAPNRVLAKAGVVLARTYEATPGWINFPQTVNRCVLSRANWPGN